MSKELGCTPYLQAAFVESELVHGALQGQRVSFLIGAHSIYFQQILPILFTLTLGVEKIKRRKEMDTYREAGCGNSCL